jgi:transposase-like protein
MRYAGKQHWSKISADLKKVYTAPTVTAAEVAFEDFAAVWRPRFPAMVAMWERSWNEFVPFLSFPPEVRRLIYTTNGIESLNARFRAAVRRRGHFPTEQATMKIRYLPVIERRPAAPTPPAGSPAGRTSSTSSRSPTPTASPSTKPEPAPTKFRTVPTVPCPVDLGFIVGKS